MHDFNRRRTRKCEAGRGWTPWTLKTAGTTLESSVKSAHLDKPTGSLEGTVLTVLIVQ